MPLGGFRLNTLGRRQGPTYRGYIRSTSSTTVALYNTSNVKQGSDITHASGTLAILKTAKLPNSNNQIVAVGGSSGRRVWHLNPVSNTWTQIYTSTAVTPITGCDIHMNEAAGKFYIVFSSSTTTTTNRMRMIIGNISTPTSTISTDSGLTDPAAAAYTTLWNTQGTLLAVRTGTTIRTYTRSGDTVSLFGTTYSLSGGQTGTGFEDISWNADGTVLVATNSASFNITRYTAASNGALTSLGTTTTPNSLNLPAFNPNTSYGGVLALPDDDNGDFSILYYNTGGSGTLASDPNATGQRTLNVGSPRQSRWSPTGDRFAIVGSLGADLYNFTFTQGFTATQAFSPLTSFSMSAPGFDWIYY